MYKNPEQIRQEKLERNYQKNLKHNAKKASSLCFYAPVQKPCYIYIIQCGDFPYYKIGITNNLEERIDGLQLGNPFRLQVIDSKRVDSKRQALATEASIHESNIGVSSSIGREWFELSAADLFSMRAILANS